MRAMLLAAGMGSRLRPLTDHLPKPAVPLLNRPLGSFAIEHLLAAGVTQLAANAHHLPHEVDRLVTSTLPRDVPRVISVEPDLLGTGGGIARAMHELALRTTPITDDELVLVMNADVLFAPRLADAIALHRANDAIATMVLRRDPRAKSLGAVDIDVGSRVRRLLGVPALENDVLDTMMFTGVHVLSRRALADLPERGCVIRQGYRRWIDRGEVVMGFVEDAPFRDLGTPREYVAAHVDLLRGAIRWPSVTPATSLVAQGIDVSRVTLVDSVVGAGASLEPGIHLERAVVWPGAVVRESHRDVILFGRERLPAV